MIIMKEQTLWQTLYACERVEAAFERTLKLIEDIGRRYTLCSTLKQNDEKRRRRFESEIQAAITGTPKRKLKLKARQIKRKQRKVSQMLKRLKKLPILRSDYLKRNEEDQEETFLDEYFENGDDSSSGMDAPNPVAYRESIQCLQAATHQELSHEMPPTMFMTIARRTTWLNGNNSNYDYQIVNYNENENENDIPYSDEEDGNTICQSCYCCSCCSDNCSDNCSCSCSYNCSCSCSCSSCYCSCYSDDNDEVYD